MPSAFSQIACPSSHGSCLGFSGTTGEHVMQPEQKRMLCRQKGRQGRCAPAAVAISVLDLVVLLSLPPLDIYSVINSTLRWRLCKSLRDRLKEQQQHIGKAAGRGAPMVHIFLWHAIQVYDQRGGSALYT